MNVEDQKDKWPFINIDLSNQSMILYKPSIFANEDLIISQFNKDYLKIFFIIDWQKSDIN